MEQQNEALKLLPAEIWEATSTAMYSADLASEDRTLPVSVRARDLDGQRMTTFGIWGGALFSARFQAWVMVPETHYSGPVTEDYRQRAPAGQILGERAGLVVKHKGQRYVLARAITLVKGLPSPATRVDLETAQAWNRDAARYGWRALHFKGAKPEWSWVGGFPVVTYRKGESVSSELVYRDGQILVGARVDLDMPEVWSLMDTVPAERPALAGGEQLVLL